MLFHANPQNPTLMKGDQILHSSARVYFQFGICLAYALAIKKKSPYEIGRLKIETNRQNGRKQAAILFTATFVHIII